MARSIRRMYARVERQRRKSERDAILLGPGELTRRSIGRTAGGPDSGAVAPTAGQENGLNNAGALSNTTVVHPGPPRALEGRRSLQMAPNVGQVREAMSRESRLPMGFRARDVERDSTTASIKFNNVMGEL